MATRRRRTLISSCQRAAAASSAGLGRQRLEVGRIERQSRLPGRQRPLHLAQLGRQLGRPRPDQPLLARPGLDRRQALEGGEPLAVVCPARRRAPRAGAGSRPAARARRARWAIASSNSAAASARLPSCRSCTRADRVSSSIRRSTDAHADAAAVRPRASRAGSPAASASWRSRSSISRSCGARQARATYWSRAPLRSPSANSRSPHSRRRLRRSSPSAKRMATWSSSGTRLFRSAAVVALAQELQRATAGWPQARASSPRIRSSRSGSGLSSGSSGSSRRTCASASSVRCQLLVQGDRHPALQVAGLGPGQRLGPLPPELASRSAQRPCRSSSRSSEEATWTSEGRSRKSWSR